MASILSAGTTSATALNMSADTSGVLQLASNNGVVALTIDTSKRVGIGTTSPITTGGSVLELSNNANCIQTITCTNDTTSLLDFRTNGVDRLEIQSSSNWGAYFLVRSNQIMKFGINNAEIAQFDTSNNFLLGTTNTSGSISLDSGVIGGRFKTASGTVVQSGGGAWTTITTIVNPGLYAVHAYIGGYNAGPSDWSNAWFITYTGANSAYVGPSLFGAVGNVQCRITSSTTVQIYTGAGAGITYTWVIQRIG